MLFCMQGGLIGLAAATVGLAAEAAQHLEVRNSKDFAYVFQCYIVEFFIHVDLSA